MRTGKRYVLIEADAELETGDVEKIASYFGQRRVKLTLIRPKENPASLIAKTNVEGAVEIRGCSADLLVGGKRLRTSLTSGSIGKLKRRVKGGGTR
jgi:hypothetical protein